KTFITVSGKTIGKIDKPVTVTWVVMYSANNDKCMLYPSNNTRLMGGASYYPSKELKYSFTSKAYTKKIPLDEIKPGFCEWKPYQIYFNVKQLKRDTVTFFSKSQKP